MTRGVSILLVKYILSRARIKFLARKARLNKGTENIGERRENGRTLRTPVEDGALLGTVATSTREA